MILALAQINPTIGDLPANAAKILEFARAASSADLVVFPELALCGYPPKDLLLAEGFLASCHAAADHIVRHAPKLTTLVFGLPIASPQGLRNALIACRDGQVLATYFKRLLPTYDVFDEDRYFVPGDAPCVIDVPSRGGKSLRVGLSICEDLWKGEDAGFAQRYLDQPDPVPDLIRAGAQLIINPSASPFVLGKGAKHRRILHAHATTHHVTVAAVNQVGGNDDLLFDGHAAVIGPAGDLLAAGPGFTEAITTIELGGEPRTASGEQGDTPGRNQAGIDPLLSCSDDALAYHALVMGVRDYCRKTGFTKATLGLSGGIDSALTVVLAAAALGPEHILGVAMPGPYSSDHSIADARESARRLGCPFTILPIADAFSASASTLNTTFDSISQSRLGATLPDLTEENLQSRLRGTMLMAISNRTGAIVLTTGNKSELAVGYCTLYGDMNGGLAVLSDVSKRLVYRLSRFINREHATLGFPHPPIPEGSIDKPPSAELRPNQTDQDSLPPYDILDAILERAVERRQSPATIARETGFDPAVVARICRLIDLSEYKRKQAAIGLKLTTVAFGSGRRIPIAQRWRP